MPKIGEKPTDIAVMSEKMKQALKAEIEKFGIKPYEFQEFLLSVKAAKISEPPYNNFVYMIYPIDRMEKYRDKFIKPHEVGLNDVFMFEKWAKRDKDFMPAMFWEKVRDL